MLRWMITASVGVRYLVLAAAVALVVLGVRDIGRMPVDVLPEFAPPTVEVQTEAIGLSAEEVESLITLGLEELLSGVPWLESTRSSSVTGLSTITLTFRRGTDIVRARQMVQERLTLEYKLPNVATPPVILQPVSSTSRFMMVGISSDTIDPTELSLLARWTIKPRLVGVPGVANVAIWGQRLRQLHVHIHPERLRDARLTQDEIIAAAGDALWVSPLTFLKASATGSGGWIDNSNQRLGVEHAMPIETPADMAKVPVTSEPELKLGRTIALGDVAEMTFSHPPLIGDAFVNGSDGLLLVLEKFPGASVPDVTRGVEQALAELARGLPGVKIDPNAFRLASYVEDSTGHLAVALGSACVLLVLVTGALLRSSRSVLVVLLTVVLTLLAALVVLHAIGATLNAMVVAGLVIALAVAVDAAVSDAEAFIGELREREPGTPILSVMLAAAASTRSTAVYGVMIVLLSAVPILMIGGVSGAFLEPFAWAYVVAVLAAAIVACTVAPALCALLFARPRGAARPSLAAAAAASCERGMRHVIAAPARAYAGLAALVAVGVVGWTWIEPSLLPQLRERELVVTWNTPPGTSHAETQRITARVSRELQSVAGVRSVVAHVGRAVTGDQVVGMNAAQIWVGLDARTDAAQTTARVRDVIEGYPGIDRGLHTYLHDRLNDVLTGESRPVVVRVYGPKPEVRRQQAEAVRDALAGVDGLVDLHVEGEVEEPQVQVKVNLDAAGRADVKPGDVRRASATVFSGMVVGYLFKEQKIFEVVVWGAPESRQSLANLRDLWIDKADRTRVRLRDVAEVAVTSAPTVIRHERTAPYVDVVANVAGRDLRAVSGEIDARLRTMSFPLEHRAELLGEIVERDHARHRLLGVIAAALAGIVLVLQACFRSWRVAAAATIGVTGAIAGAMCASLLSTPLTGGANVLGALLGCLAVLAVASRHAMLLFDGYAALEPELASDASLHDAVIAGTRMRVAGVIAGCIGTCAVLLPFIVLGSIAGLEIARSIAIVATGGVIASGVITLFVLPPLYLWARAGRGALEDLRLREV